MSTPPEDTTHTPPGPQAGADGLAAWRASGGKPGPRLDPIERLALRPTGLRAAVTAMCYECVGRDADPCWRWRVGNCTAACPLHAVRAHQHLAGTPAPAALADHNALDDAKWVRTTWFGVQP